MLKIREKATEKGRKQKMWEVVLATIIAALYFPMNLIIGKIKLQRFDNIKGVFFLKGALLSLIVFFCTFIIMLIRKKSDDITVDLTDKGVVEFTAIAPHIEPIKSYNGKRTVNVTHYYVIYSGRFGNSELKYSKKVSGQKEMENLINQKEVISLRIFKGADGKIYYGKESDTVESFLADRAAWKWMYYKILLFSGVLFIMFSILLIIKKKGIKIL